jgi:hypothetical protein
VLGVINSRLFTTVRDSLGLTYDVSFEVKGLMLFVLLSVVVFAQCALGLTYDVSFEVRGLVLSLDCSIR